MEGPYAKSAHRCTTLIGPVPPLKCSTRTTCLPSPVEERGRSTVSSAQRQLRTSRNASGNPSTCTAIADTVRTRRFLPHHQSQ